MTKTVLGIFNSREHTEMAINELKDAGYNPHDLSIVMKDKREGEHITDNTGVGPTEGVAGGAITGAVIGGLAGLVGAAVIPGLGAFLIGGPIATALGLTGAAATTVSGATTGALAGGFLGALTGLGLSQEDAQMYEKHIEEGAILLAVPAGSDDANKAREILEKHGASDMRTIDQNDTPKTINDKGHSTVAFGS